MASWNVLSPELAGFLIVLMVYIQFRKRNLISLNIVEGLLTYVPPMDQDYDFLVKGQKGGRESMDGRQKKKPKTQFPLRTMTINTEFLKNNDGFFIDHDFSIMVFILTFFSFVISCIGKVVAPHMFQTNLVFYMALFCSFLTMQYLCKSAFKGPNKKWACSDESKV